MSSHCCAQARGSVGPVKPGTGSTAPLSVRRKMLLAASWKISLHRRSAVRQSHVHETLASRCRMQIIFNHQPHSSKKQLLMPAQIERVSQAKLQADGLRWAWRYECRSGC